MPESILQVPMLADLKVQPVSDGAKVLMVGKNAIDDGLGGFYRFDVLSVLTEDTLFLNIVKSSLTETGRWIRIFQRAKTIGGGVLVMNGGVKTFFISGVTDINGEVTLNITDDGTANGNALFTEVWFMQPQATSAASGPAQAVQSYRKTAATNIKTPTFGFYKANALTITLGLLFTPVASIGAGTVVQFRVEGI